MIYHKLYVASNLHERHAQDRDKSNLCPDVHLQVPDEPDGKYSEGEIRDDREAAVYVGDDDNDVDADAFAVSGSGPEEGNRSTLQQGNEEKGDTPDNREEDDDLNNPTLGLLRGEPEEKAGNGGFGKQHARGVAQVTVPPVLYLSQYACGLLPDIGRVFLTIMAVEASWGSSSRTCRPVP